MKTFLICHESEPLNAQALPRWLASFSDLSGVLILRETANIQKKRVKRQIQRVGWFRFADVVAFRFYYKLLLQGGDAVWESRKLQELLARYPAIPESTPVLYAASPNSAEAIEFLRKCAPDVAIARCKVLLKEDVFSIPRHGTFVMHPGICPEYRNSHGCFWALASNDRENAGMTLLRIDKGVDTGPVFGYFRVPIDERESHIIIQNRVVFDNLEEIQRKLTGIVDGSARPIDTTGRKSATWGQPWLSSYLRWKWNARRRSHT
jgi:hypothetical protein